MIPQIGFSLQAAYDLPHIQMIPLLKKAGFSAVSPLWFPELDLAELVQCVQAHGMIVQSIHAPYNGIVQLWIPDEFSPCDPCAQFFATIDACARFNIPVMVLHSWSGFDYVFREEDLDFSQHDRIVAYARQKGVAIAFENLEGEEFLGALLAHYKDCTHVGYCWDSGHEHCYPHKTDFLQAYGDRLIMTHLNDNLGLRDPAGNPSGKDDLHFLPYDGNLDWDYTLTRMKSAPLQPILNFEFKIRSHSQDPADLLYLHLSLEQFVQQAGVRAMQIAEKYAQIMHQC